MSKHMRKEAIEKHIFTLDGMISHFDQCIVLGGRSQKEDEARELLKSARLKLVEDLEDIQGE